MWKKNKRGNRWKQIPMTAPEEISLVLDLHAVALAEETGRNVVTRSEANVDLLYGARRVQDLLPKARAIIKRKQEQISERQGGND